MLSWLTNGVKSIVPKFVLALGHRVRRQKVKKKGSLLGGKAVMADVYDTACTRGTYAHHGTEATGEVCRAILAREVSISRQMSRHR